MNLTSLITKGKNQKIVAKNAWKNDTHKQKRLFIF